MDYEYSIGILKKQWANIVAMLIIAEGGLRKKDISMWKKRESELKKAMEKLKSW